MASGAIPCTAAAAAAAPHLALRYDEARGWGLFAARELAPGQTLLLEAPIAVGPTTILDSAAYEELHAAPRKGRYATNAFGSAKESSVGLLISRVNHSCVPNAAVARELGGTLRLTATAAIPVGTEVTIRYVRGRAALAAYGIVCECARPLLAVMEEPAPLPRERLQALIAGVRALRA